MSGESIIQNPLAQFFISNFEKLFGETSSLKTLEDYKSTLQELVQGRYKKLPIYTVIEESGPDHEKKFLVNGLIETSKGNIEAKGKGSSKKEAEQDAAKKILKKLHED